MDVSLTPASRPEPESPEVLRGWKAADVTVDELVDDAFIEKAALTDDSDVN